MKSINMIVAIDEKNAIGKDNDLLAKIPADMAQFRKKTMGNVVVMGRKTYESMPNAKPLPLRINVVLSSAFKLDEPNDKEAFFKDIYDFYQSNKKEIESGEEIIKVSNIDFLLTILDIFDEKDIYIIGGEQIYTQLLPYASKIYLTKIMETYPADKYFPAFNKDNSWKLEYQSDIYSFNNTKYQFFEYIKN